MFSEAHAIWLPIPTRLCDVQFDRFALSVVAVHVSETVREEYNTFLFSDRKLALKCTLMYEMRTRGLYFQLLYKVIFRLP